MNQIYTEYSWLSDGEILGLFNRVESPSPLEIELAVRLANAIEEIEEYESVNDGELEVIFALGVC